MTINQRYLINSPTMAMFLEDGHHVSRMVSEGSVIVVDGETLNGNKLVPVLSANKPCLMFTQDIRNWGTKLEDNAA